MSKIECCIITLITIPVLLLIQANLSKRNNRALESISTSNIPTYKSDFINTTAYDLTGGLNYHLISQHAEYFPNEGISWFTQPVMTTFDANKVPSWSIRSERAKLINEHILYLCGHVEFNALTKDTQIQKITMSNTQINLVTQDVISQNPVKLYGRTFNCSGSKMRGNLRRKNAELIEKVRAFYDIKNKNTYPALYD